LNVGRFGGLREESEEKRFLASLGTKAWGAGQKTVGRAGRNVFKLTKETVIEKGTGGAGRLVSWATGN
jgi:hypothetical protein